MRSLVRVIRWACEAVRALVQACEAVRRRQKAACDFVASAIAGPLARILLRIAGYPAPEPNLVEKLTAILFDRLLAAALEGVVAALI
jgi:hypothetical protein